MDTMSAMVPVPPLVAPEAPPVDKLMNVTFVSPAGKVTSTVAPVAVTGPRFDTVMVNETGCPGCELDRLETFIRERSTGGIVTMLSVLVDAALGFPAASAAAPAGMLATTVPVPVIPAT